ncbi:DNA polymerase III subunit delta [Pelagibacterales bacterium SAG-MED32]|nr:DNA polymerase III subunit delta [Pelagibacterales bacterium SAG-MED32]
MIIKDFQIEKIIKENVGFLPFLVYGPNEGLIREHISKIKSDYLSDVDFEEISITGKSLDLNPDTLETSANSISMFNNYKLIILESLKDKNMSELESVIGSAPTQTMLIVKADNLKKTSKLRKLFENNAQCYALACYEDDAKSMMRLVDNFMKENDISIDRDIKNYLMQTLSTDRMISFNELQKISLFYANTDATPNLEEIKNLLNDASSNNLQRMNESVMYGNTAKTSNIISKLLSEGNNPISILRSLINYLKRVHKVKVEMKKGSNFDNAIKFLRPPLFWKDKENFQQHCVRWPLNKIEKNLSRLLDAEIDCKTNSKLSSVLCERSILTICHAGKQYFQN